MQPRGFGFVAFTTAEPVERRISLDGGHYVFEQFVEFFGEADAQWYWEQAEISTQVFALPVVYLASLPLYATQ